MTEQQHRTFTFVRDQIMATGVCPSMAEIAEHLNLKSKSNVARVIDALVRDGHLVRGARRSRRNLHLANDNLVHVATSALIAELERRGVRLG
ncbi:MAG: hypothetical protein VX205_03060 [Pseudomonadota bacterium]|nr:hypothetical protein [Pseudomonadota bacterium]MEC8033956.1 hypothetical protein [Pseudomonadota bacterium]